MHTDKLSIKKLIELGTTKSTWKMSSLHLFMISPFGVVSKKLIGRRITFASMTLKSEYELLAPNTPKKKDLTSRDRKMQPVIPRNTYPNSLSPSNPRYSFCSDHLPAQKLESWMSSVLKKKSMIARMPTNQFPDLRYRQ